MANNGGQIRFGVGFDVDQSGLNKVKSSIEAIPKSEYAELFDTLTHQENDTLKYKNTAGAVLQSIIQDLPRNAQAAADIVNQFDPQKYAEVVNFARAANGGRDIETNQPILPIEQ